MGVIWLYLSIGVLTLVCGQLYRELRQTRHRARLLNQELIQITDHLKKESAKAINREREELVGAAIDSGTAVVAAGASTTETIHKAVSGITFDILESIPVTKDTAKIVRTLHDKTADTVYSLIRMINQGIGETSRILSAPTHQDQ